MWGGGVMQDIARLIRIDILYLNGKVLPIALSADSNLTADQVYECCEHISKYTGSLFSKEKLIGRNHPNPIAEGFYTFLLSEVETWYQGKYKASHKEL